jgi:hypothetical protein
MSRFRRQNAIQQAALATMVYPFWGNQGTPAIMTMSPALAE